VTPPDRPWAPAAATVPKDTSPHGSRFVNSHLNEQWHTFHDPFPAPNM
jgi:hypothetical protein